MLFIDADTDETGRYLFFFTKNTSNKNELFVKDQQPSRNWTPSSCLHPVTCLRSLGVVDGTLYLLTDRVAPNKEWWRCSRSAGASNRKMIVAEPGTRSSRLGSSQQAGGERSSARQAVRFWLDGSPAGQITTPGLGAVSGPGGRFARQEVFYTFTSPLCRHRRCFDTTWRAAGLPFRHETHLRPVDMTRRVFASSKDGTRVPMFIRRRSQKGWRQSACSR
jgi:prolyl oligopeptidase